MTTATKFYLTQEGLEQVREEHRKLLEFRNAKMRGEMPSMLHSEEADPEYLTFQEDMNLLEQKIAEYESILKNAEIIKKPKQEKDLVDLGAIVTVDMNGEIDEFIIVGTLEADPAQKKISNESPIGRALVGKKTGDVIEVEASIVKQTCKIVKVRYE